MKTLLLMALALTGLTYRGQMKLAEREKCSPKHKLEVTFVANEGVLISDGKKSVLIDGLFRKYKDLYGFLPPEQLQSLEQARMPFDRIDLVLATHVHYDHFHPQSVGQHLKHNKKTHFIGTRQAGDELQQNFAAYEQISDRVRVAQPAWKQKLSFKPAQIPVTVLGMRHGNKRFRDIQSLGFIVELGGKRLLHVGDADTTLENFSAFDWEKESIDIAFVPYWMLSNEDNVITKLVKPKHIMALHIPPSQAREEAKKLEDVLPHVIVVTKKLHRIRF